VKKIELSATAIASTLAKLPQHLKIKSKSALFESIKVLGNVWLNITFNFVGSQATDFLKTAEEVIGALEEKSETVTAPSTLRNVSKTLKTFNSSSNLLADYKKPVAPASPTTPSR
jgi:hypothetical protein